MKRSELHQQLETLGMPVAYAFFKRPVKPPYITYLVSHSSDIMADGQNYVGVENIQIELYTSKKDSATEKKLQDKLKELRLPYHKSESFLDSEDLLQIVYEIQLIGG